MRWSGLIPIYCAPGRCLETEDGIMGIMAGKGCVITGGAGSLFMADGGMKF